MKLILGVVSVFLGVFVSLAIITGTSLVGEVVTLHTRGADGEWETTPLWIVDASDGAYLRAGDPDSGWVVRLRTNPEVRLERAGAVQDVRLVESPAMQQAISEQMGKEYGWADDFVGMMADRGSSLPLRVELVAPTS